MQASDPHMQPACRHRSLSEDPLCQQCRTASSARLIGAVLDGKYRILSRLGGGGTGEVYKAEHLSMGGFVALKMLTGEGTQAAVARARFEQEARAASELCHDCIVSVVDFGWTPNLEPYIVMNYFPGESLSDIIAKQGPLPVQQVIDIFVGVCSGLAHAHSKRILHRDLKPSNIMVSTVSGTTEAKLIDFGGSQSLQSGDAVNSCDGTGSPYYMSPEQCQGLPLDERSDVFSLGCSIYEALVGKPPFAGENVMATIYKRVHENAPRLSDNPGGRVFPARLEKIIARTLERRPEARFRSAEELRAALLSVNKGGGLAAICRPLSFSLDKSKASPWLAGAIALVLTFIAFAIWQVSLLTLGGMTLQIHPGSKTHTQPLKDIRK